MKPVLVKQSSASSGADERDGPLHRGVLVANKYQLGELLGAGSMGSVWRARHLMLGHGVAIKFLHASVEAFPEGRVRFEREGRLAARLGEASGHICRVTDFGVHGSGTAFVVMELLQGEELSTRLKREPTLPLPLIAEIVQQLCRALAAAHQAGVIHRDLKPANVFLCRREDGQGVFVKLLDFGVALAPLEQEGSESTRPGIVFGTPGYISPEQILGDPLDGRSDLWSVAVLVYRMAVGRAPFGTGTMTELALRILSTQPDAPSSVRPELPAALDAWMKRALCKRREGRFANAAELADALFAACSEQAPLAQPAGWRRVARRLRTRTALAAAAAAALLCMLAVWAQAGGVAAHQPRATAAAVRVTAAPARAVSPSAAGEAHAPALPEPAPLAAADAGASPAPAAELAPLAPEASSASAAPAPAARFKKQRRTPNPRKSVAVPLEQRAAELWNKADEL